MIAVIYTLYDANSLLQAHYIWQWHKKADTSIIYMYMENT